MIFFIAGATHTGKTLLAQKILEAYGYPYLSIDHLKMGLIRSGCCPLTPESDEGALTQYLWPVVCAMVRTAVENRQNLTVEGCYIPFDYQKSFAPDELAQMRYVCLVFSERYIRSHFGEIQKHACEIEHRRDATLSEQMLVEKNRDHLRMCEKLELKYHLIDEAYSVSAELFAD